MRTTLFTLVVLAAATLSAQPRVDGARTVSEIRDAVSAEFEPLALEAVAEYLDRLARTGAVSFKR